MNEAQAFGKAFARARVETAVAVTEAGGWIFGLKHHDQMVSGAVYFYVHDVSSKWTWMCSVPKPHFNDLIGRIPNVQPGEAAHGVAELFSKAVQAKSAAGLEEQLAMMLTVYLKNTKTFENAGRGQRAPHFYFVHYGKSKMIRPAASSESDRFPLPAQSVLTAFKTINQIDLVQHPEWAHN